MENRAGASGAIGTIEVTTAARPIDFEASLSLVCENGLAQIGGIAVNELQVYTPDPDACFLYPIAISAGSLQGLVIGDPLDDLLNGTQPGNFGWLSWTGSQSATALAISDLCRKEKIPFFAASGLRVRRHIPGLR